MKKFKITRAYLEKVGITNVTEDGRIFKGSREVNQHVIPKQHKYGKLKQYLAVTLYDEELYKEQAKKKKEGKCKFATGQRILLAHRIVYAWFNGETPEVGDVAHKDDNAFNNHINNLEAMSHYENLMQRKGQ